MNSEGSLGATDTPEASLVVEVVDLTRGRAREPNEGMVVPHRIRRLGILTIIEGANDGFTFLNWVVIAVSVVFGVQAALSLTGDGSSPT